MQLRTALFYSCFPLVWKAIQTKASGPMLWPPGVVLVPVVMHCCCFSASGYALLLLSAAFWLLSRNKKQMCFDWLYLDILYFLCSMSLCTNDCHFLFNIPSSLPFAIEVTVWLLCCGISSALAFF